MDQILSPQIVQFLVQWFGMPGLVFVLLSLWYRQRTKDREQQAREAEAKIAQQAAEAKAKLELLTKEIAAQREQRIRENAESREMVFKVLSQYKEDVAAIRVLYEKNAHLVECYDGTCSRLETLYMETLSVISLNTQTQTSLVDSIKNNLFCPLVRKEIGS